MARALSIAAAAVEPARSPAASTLASRQVKSGYVAAMAGDQARTPKVSPDFLPPGNWGATIWQDGEVVREMRRTQLEVTRKDALESPLAAAGGGWRRRRGTGAIACP